MRTPGNLGPLLLLSLGLLAFAPPGATGQRSPARGLSSVSPLSITAGMQDLGPAPASTPLRRMHLVLARSPAQEQDLSVLLKQQQDKDSPNYRRWLTPQQFGVRFGPSSGDLANLTGWLSAQGFFQVHVNSGRTLVEFSGTAANVETAFHTSIHRISSGGQTAYRAMTPPTPPAGLPIVAGFAALNRWPQAAAVAPSLNLRRDNRTGAYTALPSASVAPTPAVTINSNNTTYYGVTPYDFATIYNVLPLWTAATPVDGTGEAIAVAGETDINPADFISFRGISGFPLGDDGTPTGTAYLNIIYNGNNPGTQDSEFHAASDTQWASAAAKGAVIDYVASQSTEASSGVQLSAAYIVDNNLAPILVDSYYTCEQDLGTSGNAFYNALWQQAAAQGITVVAPTGDSGAAECDAFHVAPASGGKAVNGIASTPYNVAVGGTEFYTPNGPGAYFAPTNTSNSASAKSYIPSFPGTIPAPIPPSTHPLPTPA